MIIGLVGFKGSGKSEVAKHLVNKHGFILYNFKVAIIREIKEYYPLLLQFFSELHEMTIDELMISHGIMRRQQNSNYWVEQWAKVIDASPGDLNVIVDDVRFLNEYKPIKQRHGSVWRVLRDDITSGGSDITETEHLGIEADSILYGKKGEIDDLQKQIDNLII
jgi:hypothetical protein